VIEAAGVGTSALTPAAASPSITSNTNMSAKLTAAANATLSERVAAATAGTGVVGDWFGWVERDVERD